jgi:hypothetical protein
MLGTFHVLRPRRVSAVFFCTKSGFVKTEEFGL